MNDHDDEISKSERKRRMHALQDLGLRLLDLREETLVALALPEDVADAVRLARGLSREARRRQCQYIGKLLRRHELPDLAQRVDALVAPARAATAQLHEVEHWRDRLLTEQDVLTDFLGAYPQADAERLRALIAQAQREQAANQPPRARRALFQYLRTVVS